MGQNVVLHCDWAELLGLDSLIALPIASSILMLLQVMPEIVPALLLGALMRQFIRPLRTVEEANVTSLTTRSPAVLPPTEKPCGAPSHIVLRTVSPVVPELAMMQSSNVVKWLSRIWMFLERPIPMPSLRLLCQYICSWHSLVDGGCLRVVALVGRAGAVVDNETLDDNITRVPQSDSLHRRVLDRQTGDCRGLDEL